jgi:hypothetical protein
MSVRNENKNKIKIKIKKERRINDDEIIKRYCLMMVSN